MNRNRKKAAAATLAAGMAVVLGAERRNRLCKYNCRRRSNGCHSI